MSVAATTTSNGASTGPAGDLERQLRGWRLATAEITCRLPGHPSLLRSFVWQYDRAPNYPAPHRLLAFWAEQKEGQLFNVRVGRSELLTAPGWEHASEMWRLH